MQEADDKALAAERGAKSNKAAVWSVDAADEAHMKSAIDAASARFGGLDALVNVAAFPAVPSPPIR